jgi:hypothetical protein
MVLQTHLQIGRILLVATLKHCNGICRVGLLSDSQVRNARPSKSFTCRRTS